MVIGYWLGLVGFLSGFVISPVVTVLLAGINYLSCRQVAEICYRHIYFIELASPGELILLIILDVL